MTAADAINVEAREVTTEGPVTMPTPTETPTASLPATRTDNPLATAAADAMAAARRKLDDDGLPGPPGMGEFLSLAMQARMLSLSGAAPEAVRNNAHVAFHVAMVGRDLGISPSAAVELIDVISTQKGPRLSLSPQLLNGQIRRLGLGEIVKGHSNDITCTAIAVGPGGRDRRCRLQWPDHVDDCQCDILGTSIFTWEDAQQAGLAGPDCQPGDHKMVTRQRRNGGGSYQACGCNQGYITYPRRMLWWRAAGFAGDDWFPEAGLGLYSPEALGAVIDAEGRPIDPATVELPEGYDDPQEAKREREAAREATADPEALWDLQLTIAALPEDRRKALSEAWRAEDSRLRGRVARALPAGLLRAAKAMTNAHWAQAVKDGADKDQCMEATRRALGTALVNWLCAWGAVGPQDDPPSVTPHAEGQQADTATDSPEPGAAADDGLPANPEFDVDGPGDTDSDAAAKALEARAAKAKWLPIMHALSEEVQAEGEGVPDDVVEAIGTEVQATHWSRINATIADAGLAGDYPPDSPIQLRYLVVTLLRLQAWQATQTEQPQ